MTINIDGKDVELKYTYNSFRYMEDLDINEINSVDHKPFKLITLNEILLLGALNHNPKVVYTIDTARKYLMETLEDKTYMDLTNNLIEMLEKSSFFQNLQEMES